MHVMNIYYFGAGDRFLPVIITEGRHYQKARPTNRMAPPETLFSPKPAFCGTPEVVETPLPGLFAPILYKPLLTPVQAAAVLPAVT